MTFDRAFGIAGLVIPFLIVPIGGLVLQWFFSRRPARAILRLQRQARLDVVATTSYTDPQKRGHADAHLTAIGELRAIAVATRTVARHYRRKKLSLFVSEEYTLRPEGDLLLLGGPIKNDYSRGFLERFNFDYPAALLELDAKRCIVRIGGVDLGRYDQRYTPNGVPRRDLGIVLLSSWTEDSPQRVILCAGLTTYGTEAAARFLFEEVLKKTQRGRYLRRAMRDLPLVAVVQADIVGRQVIRSQLHENLIWTAGRGFVMPGAPPAPADGTPRGQGYSETTTDGDGDGERRGPHDSASS